MSIEAAFLLTPTISFISYGKIMFDLCAHFQEHNYRKTREVAVTVCHLGIQSLYEKLAFHLCNIFQECIYCINGEMTAHKNY
jgi:hypothetical protein